MMVIPEGISGVLRRTKDSPCGALHHLARGLRFQRHALGLPSLQIQELINFNSL
jgi:hypothetical protein